MSSEAVSRQAQVPLDAAGARLDQVLARLFPEFSRGRLQTWTKRGDITIDGNRVKPSFRVRGGEDIRVEAALVSETGVKPERIPLDVLHEDDDVLVLNKPAGLVVHPAAGHAAGTLQNALLNHDSSLSGIPRAGIVHRLDKLTSGVMIVAKSLRAHRSLVDQLQERSMSRQYLALVRGAMVAGGTVDARLGRHPRDRKKNAVIDNGKRAITHYRVRERFAAFTLLDVSLETGRTHQIRVHMAHARYPLVGDPLYGGRVGNPKGANAVLLEALSEFKRQALHARKLAFEHPEDGREMAIEAPIPEDLAHLLAALRQDAGQTA